MEIKITEIKSCCGKSSNLLKTSKTISKEMIDKFKSLGFKTSDSYLKSGILYVEDQDLVLSGAIGSLSLQCRCKKKESCKDSLSKLEQNLKDF